MTNKSLFDRDEAIYRAHHIGGDITVAITVTGFCKANKWYSMKKIDNKTVMLKEV